MTFILLFLLLGGLTIAFVAMGKRGRIALMVVLVTALAGVLLTLVGARPVSHAAVVSSGQGVGTDGLSVFVSGSSSALDDFQYTSVDDSGAGSGIRSEGLHGYTAMGRPRLRIGVAAMVLAIIVLVGLIIAFVASGRRGRMAMLVVLVLAVAGIVLSLVSYRAVDRSPAAILSSTSSDAQYPLASRSAASLPIWSEGLDDQFAADVYPSLKAAALGLARQTVQDLDLFLNDGNTPNAIHVFGEPTKGQGLTEESINAFVDRVQRSIRPRKLTLSLEAPLERAAPDTVTIWLKQPLWKAPSPQDRSGLVKGGSGTLGVAISDGERSMPRSTEFMLKPWVDSFGHFVNRPGHRPGQFQVALSYDTCTDAGEALNQALAGACVQVKEAISQLDGTLQEALTVGFEVTVQDLQTAGFIEDSFAQSFQGSVGKIWRHALLLNVSPDKLTGLREAKIRHARRAHLTWARLAGSALGLAFLIFILYIFLNAATKGYYTIALRVVAFLLIVTLGAILFCIA